MDAALLGLRFEEETGRPSDEGSALRVRSTQVPGAGQPDTHLPSKEGLYLECSRCGKQTDAPTIGMPGAPDGVGGIALGGGG
jgi:hypothetical protein